MIVHEWFVRMNPTERPQASHCLRGNKHALQPLAKEIA